MPDTSDALATQWEAWDIGVELVVLPSPYRSILRPLVDYVERSDASAARPIS